MVLEIQNFRVYKSYQKVQNVYIISKKSLDDENNLRLQSKGFQKSQL